MSSRKLSRLIWAVSLAAGLLFVLTSLAPADDAGKGETDNLPLLPQYAEETRQALQHIAERENIPLEQLTVVNQHYREYALLNRNFWAVTVFDVQTKQFHNVMMDLADGSFVDDIETIEHAKRAAHQSKYGKLEPDLYERLQNAQPNEQIPVAIWIAGPPKQGEGALYTKLAAKYPEAQAAWERENNIFAVDNPQLVAQLKAEYIHLLEMETQARIQPLASYIEKQGYSIKTFGALPVVSSVLVKSVILDLAERADVGIIYLTGQAEKVTLDSAVPSTRASVVWRRGFEGNGSRIAILEGGKIDFDGPAGHNYLHEGVIRL